MFSFSFAFFFSGFMAYCCHLHHPYRSVQLSLQIQTAPEINGSARARSNRHLDCYGHTVQRWLPLKRPIAGSDAPGIGRELIIGHLLWSSR
ncbi:hypothetical protein MHYP_G00082720 [Metynnis hypsauchen]